uniref:Uncharacterized protein n=1 Tax=Corethron hystrix TaxID=216773 RepID=A0A7S1BU58_9STRA|mmetsp:Transcript_38913/g.90535  ORF Transcript_38913/g.90535 Transcript_38913/m.90535 type:complete len:172 (+) Transcript_38913:396-911(+)
MSSPTIAFAKRPEVTVSTMGKVHNPSGSGVAATSSVVKAKLHQQHQNGTIAPPSSPALVVHPAANGKHVDSLDTRVKEEGSSRRNIVRKKSADVRFDKNKKQGGAGKNKWALDDGSDAVYATPTDVNDPLYDEFEDNDKNFILTTAQEAEAKAKNYDENVGCVVYGPMLSK